MPFSKKLAQYGTDGWLLQNWIFLTFVHNPTYFVTLIVIMATNAITKFCFVWCHVTQKLEQISKILYVQNLDIVP